MTGQLPFPPVVFWLLAKLAELCPCRPVYPQGKTREIFGGNKRRRSAGEDFFGAQAPTQEGLEGPERARTIRQDSSQKASQTRQGQGRRSPAEPALDPTAGRASGRPYRCEPWRTPTPLVHSYMPARMKEGRHCPCRPSCISLGNKESGVQRQCCFRLQLVVSVVFPGPVYWSGGWACGEQA